MVPQTTSLDYYVVLGVSQEASMKELQDRYESLARDPAASKHIHEAYVILADAENRSAYDSLLPEIQWKLKCMSVLGLFGGTTSSAVAYEEKKKANDGESAHLSVISLEQAPVDVGADQGEAETKESVAETTPITASSPFVLAEEQEPGSNPADLTAADLNKEEASDATSVVAKVEVEAAGEPSGKPATAARKDWEWHQQKEGARKLARFFSEKLIKEEFNMEVVFKSIQSLEAARVTNATERVAKKHAIQALIDEISNIHTEPIVPKPPPPRLSHLRLSPEEAEKKQQADVHLQYVQRLLLERNKEVRLVGFKNDFRKLLDEFAILNYKILAERIVAGLTNDILKEGKAQRSAEKGAGKWFAELEKTESVRLKEVYRVASQKDELMKVGIVEILKKGVEEGKSGGKNK